MLSGKYLAENALSKTINANTKLNPFTYNPIINTCSSKDFLQSAVTYLLFRFNEKFMVKSVY